MLFNWLVFPSFISINSFNPMCIEYYPPSCNPDQCNSTYMFCNNEVICDSTYFIRSCNGSPNVSYGQCNPTENFDGGYSTSGGPSPGKYWYCNKGHHCVELCCGSSPDVTGGYTCGVGVVCETHTGSCTATGCFDYHPF